MGRDPRPAHAHRGAILDLSCCLQPHSRRNWYCCPAALGPPMLRFALFTLLVFAIPAAAEEPHWAFRPIKRPPVPEVRSQKSEVRNEIDRFVLAKLNEKGLAFAPPADRRTLIRRVTFDLIGLPPTPEEVEAFVNDKSPDAYEKVDRPLARLAPLRRALGPALARPRALRRHQRLRVRRTATRRLALSRLRHPRVSTPTSRSTASSWNNSPATKRFPATRDALDRHRLQPARPGHDRRVRPGAAPAEHAQRHDRHGRHSRSSG